MSPFAISLLTFACVFGGALLGILLRSALPAQHLSGESKDIVRLGMGLVGTIAALVLGLLVASAKSSYDAQRNQLTQLSANVAFLDRILTHYGPEAVETRDLLRDAAVRIGDRLWKKEHTTASDPEPNRGVEAIYDKIQQLAPKDDRQRTLQKQALKVANKLGEARWLMYEQSIGSVPSPLLAVLVLWLTIIFVSFGLFPPATPLWLPAFWSLHCRSPAPFS